MPEPGAEPRPEPGREPGRGALVSRLKSTHTQKAMLTFTRAELDELIKRLGLVEVGGRPDASIETLRKRLEFARDALPAEVSP